MSHIPVSHGRKVHGLQDDMAQLGHGRRFKGRADGGVDAPRLPVAVRVMVQRCTQRKRGQRLLAGYQALLVADWVDELDTSA
jgi:hypothetical protein